MGNLRFVRKSEYDEILARRPWSPPPSPRPPAPMPLPPPPIPTPPQPDPWQMALAEQARRQSMYPDWTRQPLDVAPDPEPPSSQQQQEEFVGGEPPRSPAPPAPQADSWQNAIARVQQERAGMYPTGMAPGKEIQPPEPVPEPAPGPGLLDRFGNYVNEQIRPYTSAGMADYARSLEDKGLVRHVPPEQMPPERPGPSFVGQARQLARDMAKPELVTEGAKGLGGALVPPWLQPGAEDKYGAGGLGSIGEGAKALGQYGLQALAAGYEATKPAWDQFLASGLAANPPGTPGAVMAPPDARRILEEQGAQALLDQSKEAFPGAKGVADFLNPGGFVGPVEAVRGAQLAGRGVQAARQVAPKMAKAVAEELAPDVMRGMERAGAVKRFAEEGVKRTEPGPIMGNAGKEGSALKEPWQMTAQEANNYFQYDREGSSLRQRILRVAYAEDEKRLPRLREHFPPDRQTPLIKNTPEQVTVFRGAPVGVGLRPGDWVTLDRKYAAGHLTGRGKGAKVISAKVPAEDVVWAGTDENEFFYAPKAAQELNAQTAHEAAVRQAVAEGRPVPPEVLAEYPDLARGAPSAPQASISAPPTLQPPAVPEEAQRLLARAKGATTPRVFQGEVIESVPPMKPLYEMTYDELDTAYQQAKAADKNLEVAIFGEEGAKKYRQLQQVANSTMRPFKETYAASDAIERMEAALTEQQRNRLFYRIGEEYVDPQDIRAMQSAIGGLDYESPEALGRSLRWAVTNVGEKTNPALMTGKEQEAYAQLRQAFQTAQEMHWDTRVITDAAIRASAGRFADVNDAEMMLEPILRRLRGQAEQAPVAPVERQLSPPPTAAKESSLRKAAPDVGEEGVEAGLEAAQGRAEEPGALGGALARQGEQVGPAAGIERGLVPSEAGGGRVPPREPPTATGAFGELPEGPRVAPFAPFVPSPRSTHIPGAPALGEMYAQPTARRSLGGLEDAWRTTVRAKDAVVRTFTDEGVDLAKWQQEMAKAKGAPLAPDEMAAELKRLNPDKAAEVSMQEGLAPAIQMVGNDRNMLSEYLTYMDNIDVAKAMGQKVQKEGMQANLPGVAASDLNRERARLRMLKDPARIAESQKKIVYLERKAARSEAQRSSKAVQAALSAEENRKFSFGLSMRDSEDRVKQMERMLGPERMQKLWDAADKVGDFRRQLLQRSVDSGRISQELADELTQMYPNYVPTRILDYIDEPTNVARGKSLSMRDNGLRRNTVEGTTREREDPLASMVRLAYQTEAGARKNEAFNAFLKLREMSPEMQSRIRPVSDSYVTTNKEIKVTGFVKGERQTYVMPKELKDLIESEPRMVISGFAGAVWSGMMNAFRAAATSRNPLFLGGNAFLDAGTFIIRESSRAGGPQNLPKVLAALGQAYGDAFQGVLQGTYHGKTAEFLKGGGGMFGFFQGTPGAARQTVERLGRQHILEVNSAKDIARLTADLLTFKPVTGLGERIELAPRVAAYKLAQGRGANEVQAVIGGRTVTIDFSQGGSVSKLINQFVPFFNVGVQASVQPIRAFRENPKGFLATVAGLLAGPTVAAEAWNRSDEQRARDYEDVPQYLKDQGIVIMLPGEAPVDAHGDRRPQFVHIRLREFAPFTTLTREAVSRALGDDPREWKDLISGTLGSASPIQGNNPADVLSSFVPLGTSTGLQLATNQDYFRGRMIATKGGDERASALGKGVASVTGARPSQVDFAARDLGAGLGGIALAASNLAAGKVEADTPQTIPGVGGFYGRFVKGSTGGQLDKAREHLLTPEGQKVLKDLGVDISLSPVGWEINHLPLTMAEEGKYQTLVNQYTDEMLRELGAMGGWEDYNAEQRERIVRNQINAARKRARADVLQGISIPEWERRMEAVRAAG